MLKAQIYFYVITYIIQCVQSNRDFISMFPGRCLVNGFFLRSNDLAEKQNNVLFLFFSCLSSEVN